MYALVFYTVLLSATMLLAVGLYEAPHMAAVVLTQAGDRLYRRSQVLWGMSRRAHPTPAPHMARIAQHGFTAAIWCDRKVERLHKAY